MRPKTTKDPEQQEIHTQKQSTEVRQTHMCLFVCVWTDVRCRGLTKRPVWERAQAKRALMNAQPRETEHIEGGDVMPD